MSPVLYSRNLPAFGGEISASILLQYKKVRTMKPILLSQTWRCKVCPKLWKIYTTSHRVKRQNNVRIKEYKFFTPRITSADIRPHY